MGVWISDCGSRYIVKEENLDAAAEWLSAEWYGFTEPEQCRDYIINNCEDVFYGDVPYNHQTVAHEFMERFCEPGSYACFFDEENLYHAITWKDEYGTHDDGKPVENPYTGKIEELERHFW